MTTQNDSLIGWIPCGKALPAANKEVAVKGDDHMGEWEITGGVWWQPYKGKAHQQGRWMQKNGIGKADRLPESDEVTHWRYV